jgi:tryptophanyl-tRNA synthetase
MAFVERVFSGIQPTGNLHLGNYLGAIINFVKLQETHNCLYCVVDMHALTQPVEVWGGPAGLAHNTREVTAAFIASGIDPKKHIVFNQSQVAGHAELTWIFNCVARLGWLNRMTQFKEKAGKDRENASIGLYDYPVLMAADILLYRATHVPVGEDQKQHLELSRDIAQKFNNDFGDSIRSHGHDDGLFFPLPEPLITGPATRVMSLRDGTKKMSKSDASDNSRINLTDDADTIAQKIRKAKTDPEPLPSEEKGLETRPEADNLVGIFAALSGRSKADVLREFGGGQFSNFKNSLAELCIAKLSPIASEMKRLVADPGHIDAILVDGADRARAIAAETMTATKDIVGFVRKS